MSKKKFWKHIMTLVIKEMSLPPKNLVKNTVNNLAMFRSMLKFNQFI